MLNKTLTTGHSFQIHPQSVQLHSSFRKTFLHRYNCLYSSVSWLPYTSLDVVRERPVSGSLHRSPRPLLVSQSVRWIGSRSKKSVSLVVSLCLHQSRPKVYVVTRRRTSSQTHPSPTRIQSSSHVSTKLSTTSRVDPGSVVTPLLSRLS